MPTEKSSTHVFVLRAILAAVMIILAAVVRILPHPWNFTPIGAMAIFSGATSWYRGFIIFFAAGKFTQSWKPHMRPRSCFGISECTMP